MSKGELEVAISGKVCEEISPSLSSVAIAFIAVSKVGEQFDVSDFGVVGLSAEIFADPGFTQISSLFLTGSNLLKFPNFDATEPGR